MALATSSTATAGTKRRTKARPIEPAPIQEAAAEPVREDEPPDRGDAKRPAGTKQAKPNIAPASPGTSREAIAYTIVMQLAQAEGKLAPDDLQAFPTFTRQWMFDAFTFAWKCLQVPKS